MWLRYLKNLLYSVKYFNIWYSSPSCSYIFENTGYIIFWAKEASILSISSSSSDWTEIGEVVAIIKLFKVFSCSIIQMWIKISISKFIIIIKKSSKIIIIQIMKKFYHLMKNKKNSWNSFKKSLGFFF